MNPPLGVAILGTGDVSNGHIRAWKTHPETEVRAILSRDRARAEAFVRAHGLEGCRAYTSLDELLKQDGLDIVSICTPHHLHAEQGIAAAQSGRHVVVEKPVALNLEDLRKLDRAIREANVRSIVSFVLRWNPLFEMIRALLAKNTIGDLFYGEVDYLHGITPALPLYPWVRQRAYGGSALLTAGCHAVDALRWFAQQEATEVFCYANTSPGNPLNYEYEPNSVALIQFAGGMMGKVATSIESVAPYTFPIALMGNQGTIRNNRVFSRHWTGQTGWATIPTILPDSGAVDHHPFVPQMAHFVECIRTGAESHCSVADTVKTHEICLAAGLSLEQRRPVRLPLPM